MEERLAFCGFSTRSFANDRAQDAPIFKLVYPRALPKVLAVRINCFVLRVKSGTEFNPNNPDYGQ